MMSSDQENSETTEDGITMPGQFFLLLILGFVFVVVGIALILIATVLYGGGSASIGAFILIGPFPIVVGAGPDATWIILFSIFLSVLSAMVFLVLNRRIRRSGD